MNIVVVWKHMNNYNNNRTNGLARRVPGTMNLIKSQDHQVLKSNNNISEHNVSINS